MLFPEENLHQAASPLRGAFENRAGKPMPGDFTDIFHDPKQGPADVPFSRVLQGANPTEKPPAAGFGLGTASIPLMQETSVSSPSRQLGDVFSDDRPSLNPVNMPDGPSSYTKIVNSSALRTSQEHSGAGSAAPPTNLPPAAQAPQMYQMPQMIQVQQPMIQMPQIQAPQMMPAQPMVQMPTMVAPPQPSVPTLPQAQLSAQDSGNSKWAPYMPLIIAMNVFLLLAMFLVLIVFLASKK